MRVAVTYDKGMIFEHFGRCEEFKIFEIEDNKVISSEVIGSDGLSHGALIDILVNRGVDVLICGGIGPGAINKLIDANIKTYASNRGLVDEVIALYIDGKLEENKESNCNHDHNHNCH